MSLTITRTGVAALQDQLLVQCGPADIADVIPSMRPGAGLVLTGNGSVRTLRALRRSFDGPALCDRARYKGAARVPASVGLTLEWIDKQRAAGVTAPLSDSGYVAVDDRQGLGQILADCAKAGSDVIAALPLAQEWLRRDIAVLTETINEHGVPVALMVEHRADPFSVQRNLVGLVDLLHAAQVPVMVLRSDTSALGALAHGAMSAAFGVRSALRHFTPPSKGFATQRRGAALFDPGLYMVHVDRLALGVAALPDDPMWLCFCSVCSGRSLDHLLLASEAETTKHTLELLLAHRDELAGSDSGSARIASWRAMCASAVYQFTSVAVTNAGWTVPPAINWWATL